MILPTGIDWENELRNGLKPIDPYFVWAELTGFTGYTTDPALETAKLPFLVESKSGDFTTPSVELSEVQARLIDDKKVLRWQLGAARLNARPQDERTIKTQQAKVVAAVLDDGCPLFHKSYLRYDATAKKHFSTVRMLWHQGRSFDTTYPIWQKTTGIPQTFEYGVELDPDELDELEIKLQKQVLSEDDAYEVLDYLLHAGQSVSASWRPRYHGAAVLSQVSGNPSPSARLGNLAVDPDHADWPTVFVQFPSTETYDTSGGWLGVRVLDGLRYAVDRAKRGFRDGEDTDPVPVVACVSYGGLAGRHDGSSMLERAMICLLNEKENERVHIVLPAGNAYDRAVHAVAEADLISGTKFNVFVPPDSPQPCFIELWFDKGVETAQIQAILKAPDGGWVTINGVGYEVDVDGRFGAVLAHEVAQSINGTMLLVAIQPTRLAAPQSKNPHKAAPAGVWSIEVKAPGKVDAWIERDDVTGGIPRAQQSRFIGKEIELSPGFTPEAKISNDDTLSSIANAQHPRLYVVGSVHALYDPGSLCDAVTPYTAAGKNDALGAVVWGPGLSARSDVSPSLRGVVCGGVRSGDTYRSSGTSIAAAIAARYLLTQLSASVTPPASTPHKRRVGKIVP